MGFSDAIRHYYEYEKWKFTIIVVGIGLVIITVGGLIWYFLVGAPTWNTFVENLAGYFTNIGQSTIGSFADLQTWIINYWYILVELILFFPFVGMLIYGLTVKGKRRKLFLGIGTIGAGVVGFSLVTTTALAYGGYLENPFKGSSATSDPVITHYYVLFQFDGYFRGGSIFGRAELDVNTASATKHLAIGNQETLKWTIVSHSWTIDENNPVAIVRVYAKIKFSDGSTWGEYQLWQGKYKYQSQFDFTLRFDCPTGKTPQQFFFRVEMLNYFLWWHYSYETVYSNQWSL